MVERYLFELAPGAEQPALRDGGWTTASEVFGRAPWLAATAGVDFSRALTGEVERGVASVSDGETMLAGCSYIIPRGEQLYFGYSMRRAFFSSWDEQLAASVDDVHWSLPWVSRVTRGLPWLFSALGVRTDAWIVVVNPLSHVCALGIHPGRHDECEAAVGVLIDGLRREAARRNVPLCFFGVKQEDAKLRGVLSEGGFNEFFLTCDTYMDPPGSSFDDYLRSLSKGWRKDARRTMRSMKEQGIEVVRLDDPHEHAGRLAELYQGSYSKYGDDYIRLDASFWASLSRELGDSVEFVAGVRDGEIVAFSTVLFDGECARAFRGGQDDSIKNLYFAVRFYEPIRRAYARKCRRVWFGAGQFKTKAPRGAKLEPFYGHFWFPSRRSRALLGRYLEAFTNQVRRTLVDD